MSRTTRRSFLNNTLAGGLAAAGVQAWGPGTFGAPTRYTDVRIENVSVAFAEFAFRSPFKFAGVVVTRQTMSTVSCTVRTSAGKVASGFEVLPLNYTFTFPSSKLTPADRLAAMQALAEELAKVTGAYREFGHPIDIYWNLAPAYNRAAHEVSQRLKLADPIPKLCTLVTAAAFDAAILDAFGKLHGISSFHTYGPEFMTHDLARYLGTEYAGEYPSRYLRRDPKPSMPLCHLISAVDPLHKSDIVAPLNDGLPETLPDWIDYNGLTHFKIKLNGDDLDWDIDRMRQIDRVVSETQQRRRVGRWTYIPDFNEKCPHVEYYLSFLNRVRETMPAAFQRIEYVEQPTHRDLAAHPENDMHAAAKLRPVVIDESVIDVDSVHLAQKLGWTGIVVKSPKGLSHMLLMAAVAGKYELLVAGGDMTCPGAALIQTVSFQARLPGVTNIEANARQFLPAANQPWEVRFPGMFQVSGGMLRTAELVQPGLGA
jgi:L-alanine-DL-glutamate epimerase-like enolase superfamily enzyme